MPGPRYKIHRIRTQQKKGITQPSSCTLGAILKFDSNESPHCVYNEHVAVRLAQTLHIPVAAGVLTTAVDGTQFASLEINAPGLPLPDMATSRIDQVTTTYPVEAAALTLFDILIGNYDRGTDVKAALVTPHARLFAGFDHSHALLNIENDPLASIRRLALPLPHSLQLDK